MESYFGINGVHFHPKLSTCSCCDWRVFLCRYLKLGSRAFQVYVLSNVAHGAENPSLVGESEPDFQPDWSR